MTTPSPLDLKPCPFCGAQPKLVSAYPGSTEYATCETNRCAGFTLIADIAAWNARPPAAPSPPAPETDDGMLVAELESSADYWKQKNVLYTSDLIRRAAAALRRSGSASVPATKEQICRHGRNTYVDDCGLCERFGDDAPASGMAETCSDAKERGEGCYRAVQAENRLAAAEQNDRRFMEVLGDVLRAHGFADYDVATVRADVAVALAALYETSEGGKDG